MTVQSKGEFFNCPDDSESCKFDIESQINVAEKLGYTSKKVDRVGE